jgi:hypothetical protein
MEELRKRDKAEVQGAGSLLKFSKVFSMHRVADMNNKLHDKKYDYIMPRVVTVEYDK